MLLKSFKIYNDLFVLDELPCERRVTFTWRD